jgi:glycosyltransferase involved in cell wall biosynthesis/SAM-dependent methyltransferase
MKIAIDISMALGQSAGVGTYTRGLIDGLATVDPENEYVLFSYLEIPEPSWLDFLQQPNISYRQVKVDGGHWEQQWYLAELPPKEVLKDADILHSPFFNAPRDHPAGLVVTIHDISFLLHPQFHTEGNRLHCLNGTLKAALYADRIIAVSHQSKQDLMHYFSVPEDRIRVVYEAPRRFCYPERNRHVLQETLGRLGIYHDFILFVGSLEPRKNLKTLLEAYATYIKAPPGRDLLVIAGAKGWLNDEITQMVSALGLEGQVKLLGYVQESDLRVLYSATKLFVYPSLYEGFGLPPLEAMACGAPVITSNTSALPEVAGDAALLIDPRNSDELCQAMQRVLCDDDLRMRMRRRSLARAKLFSWEQTAEQTLAVYEEACPERSKEARAARIGRKIQKSWDQFGKEDPFWAVLTNPDRKGNRWNEAEFFETGRQDIRSALERIQGLGLALKYDKALDFGCGPGRVSQALAEYFQEVHGVDIAPSMIAKAHELNKHGDRCIYHFNETPNLCLFEADMFDLVYSWLVLQHMPKQLALGYIAEFARVTKPGGVMVFQVPDCRQSPVLAGGGGEGDLPFEFWRAQEPLMLMCETPYVEVVKVLEAAGARVIEAEEDSRADPLLVFRYYVATKEVLGQLS